LLRISQVAHSQPDGLGSGRGLGLDLFLGRLGDGLVGLQFANHHAQLFGAPAAEHGEHALAAWLGVAHHARQVGGLLNRLAVEFGDDVARLYARLVSRRAALDAAHQCALRLAQADGFGHVLGHLVDLHADAPARDGPVARNWSLTRMASSMGMANEMPMKPPERE
jgi:hypothetical protein